MKSTDLFNEDHRATYCPEDNKLRLYVGRVPRPEYDALRAEGWQSTAKQDCDFSAVWTPDREDTALSYAGIIEDEDASPADRAADRAERFEGYLGKRLNEATGHADRFDAGPAVHGFQSYARAVRSADRHDRIASRAVNAWDKAEYWQHRTAGVIAHALHLSSPGVRMGRIKTLEAELRKALAGLEERREDYRRAVLVSQDPAGFVAATMARNPGHYDDKADAARNIGETLFGWWEAKHPRNPEAEPARAWHLMDPESADPLTLPEVCALWLASHREPPTDEEGTRTIRHLRLRLAYENQMLEAQGGRAASLEMVKGGTLGGRVIAKVNKSTASGRVVSVAVIGPKVSGWTYQASNEPGTDYALYTIKTERLAPGSYVEPTPESMEKLKAFEDAKKAALAAHKEKVPTVSLVNPTMEDAQRLQDAFNAATVARWEREHGRKVSEAASYHTLPKQGEIWKMTQAEYSAASKGSYSRFETREVCALGVLKPAHSNLWSSTHKAEAARRGPVLVKVRVGGYEPYRVVHITDKPAKPLPAAVWQAFTPEHTPESLKPRARELVEAVCASQAHAATDEQKQLIAQGAAAGLVNDDCRQAAMTDAGHTWAREAGAYTTTV
jgi:hypothetical protein